MIKPDKHVIILAGGNGARFGNSIPKQFALIAGKPLLIHTFEAFSHIDKLKFTLVLGEKQLPVWDKICLTHNFQIPHKIISGGLKRFHSVKNGLLNIPNDVLVLIHDAARPFASKNTISKVINVAIKKGNAIPSINVTDTLRETDNGFNQVIDRDKIKLIQTPQAFNSTLIKNAYNQEYNHSFTDDSSVLESTGVTINLVEGNIENIKISSPPDLVIAEALSKYIDKNS